MHTILTGPVITAAMGLPANLASTLLQQHVNSTLQGQATLTPLQVVTQNANNVSQRSVQNQVYNRNLITTNFITSTFYILIIILFQYIKIIPKFIIIEKFFK